jgi:Lrp/AsnC family leucine-responsive transcriptional regulator
MIKQNFENSFNGIDRVILQALIANARITTSALARKVGLSPPTVAERVRRLEDAGVITGFGAQVSPEALGLAIGAWIRIRPLPGGLEKVTALIRDIPEIVTCDRITGEDCFLARVHLPSVVELERIIDRLVGYATTNTSIIQPSPVAERMPAIPKPDKAEPRHK